MQYPIELMGLKLKNAVMTAAGPWAGTVKGIQRCIDAGAAAVITETMSLEARPRISPRLYMDGTKLFNTMLYSTMHLEEWERIVDQIDRKGAKIIFSIWGNTASELAYLGRKAEKMGADALEISLSAPIGARNQLVGNYAPNPEDFIRATIDAVSIPVMVKLSYEAATSPEFLRKLENAGVAAFSAIDALKGLSGVDIETRRAGMPTYGGYTGENIRPASRATTAMLRQYTPLPVVSCGGILNFKNALEFMMLGASAVQLASAILLNGYEVISSIVASLDTWLETHGCRDITEIRDAALTSLRTFEDIVPRSLTASITEPCARPGCPICSMSCLERAISRGEKENIIIDPEKCDGCGLCVARCPDRILKLGWR